MTSINLGDIPTWVQAITTTGALYFAWSASRTALRLYRVEAGRDEERMRAARREQAARVCIWMEQDTDAEYDDHVFSGFHLVDGSDLRQRAQRWEPLAVVRNASDLPISDLIIWFERETVRGPGDSKLRNDAQDFLLIPPGQTFKFRASRELLEPRSYGNADIAFNVSLYFKDAAGREWIRHGDGRLEPTSRSKQAGRGASASHSSGSALPPDVERSRAATAQSAATDGQGALTSSRRRTSMG